MRKRAAALLVALVGAVVVILGGTATPALAADTPINGILVNAGQPVAGVVITVSNDSGFSEKATSGTDGTWKVIAPGGGSYTVELDTDAAHDLTSMGPSGHHELEREWPGGSVTVAVDVSTFTRR